MPSSTIKQIDEFSSEVIFVTTLLVLSSIIVRIDTKKSVLGCTVAKSDVNESLALEASNKILILIFSPTTEAV